MNRVASIERSGDKKFAPNSQIVISEWSGRLGNNLIQLSNGIYLSLRYGGRLQYPSHKFLKAVTLDFSEQEPASHYFSRFYDHRDCRGAYPTLAERRFIMFHYVRDLLTFDLDRQPLSEDEDRLVLQIRSGDSFNRVPNPKYVPAPISFFRKIIRAYDGKEVVIVCENLKNPVIEKLAAEFPDCSIQSSDLESDIQTIVNASNLVITLGTFGFTLALLSKKLQRLYVDDLAKSILDFGFFDYWDLGLDMEVLRYRIHDYTRFGQWKNKPAQIDLMLNHPEEKVVQVLHEATPQVLADYYLHSWKSFYAEEGHQKLLAGLKQFIRITSEEHDQPNILAIDVGANTGRYLRHHLRKLCKNEKTQFLAFEPNPVNFPDLERNAAMMDNCKVQLYRCCLSDVDGVARFYNSAGRETNQAGNVVGGLNAGGAVICETEVHRLDTILDEIEGDFLIKFLKIDAEGADTRIIKGLGKYLDKTKYIIFEAAESLDDYRGPGIENPLRDIVDHLDGYGFDIYRMGSEKLIPINGKFWNEVYEKKKFWSNCFALRKDDALINQLIDKQYNYVF